MADKSAVANILDAQVKDYLFGDVIKRIVLNNVMNRLHDRRNVASENCIEFSEIRCDLIRLD